MFNQVFLFFALGLNHISSFRVSVPRPFKAQGPSHQAVTNFSSLPEFEKSSDDTRVVHQQFAVMVRGLISYFYFGYPHDTCQISLENGTLMEMFILTQAGSIKTAC